MVAKPLLLNTLVWHLLIMSEVTSMRNATGKRGRPRKAAGKRYVVPKTAAQYFAMSERSQDRWDRVTHVVSKMRADGVSLQTASREFALDPRTVVRLARTALRKGKDGRYTAKPTDKLLRVLVIPTSQGLGEIAVRDSREASLVGKYWAAVQKYLETGDASALQRIRRKTVKGADGKRIRLIKELTELDRLGSAGVLSFEEIYGKAA
jgi:hypothetical protein